MNIIIKARLSSKRLQSKVLFKIKNKHILDYLLDRLEFSSFNNKIFIATSNEKSDYLIEDYCKKRKVTCFRGDLNNVSKRFYDLINYYSLKSFMRLCADSPLIDPKIVDKGISIFNKKNNDLVTNKFPRSYPIGQTIEIINAQKYLDTINLVKTKSEKENVTEHFYKNSNLFNIKNFKIRKNLSLQSLAIDNKNNLIKFKSFVDKNNCKINKISYQSIIKQYDNF